MGGVRKADVTKTAHHGDFTERNQRPIREESF